MSQLLLPAPKVRKLVMSSILATFVVILSISQPWKHKTEILGSLLLPDINQQVVFQNPEAISRLMKKKNTLPVIVKINKKKYQEVTLADLGISVIAPELEQAPSKFAFFEEYLAQTFSPPKPNPEPIHAQIMLDHATLEEYVEELKEAIEVKPEKPKVTWSFERGWHYQPIQKGLALDEKALQKNLPKIVSDLQKGVEIPVLHLITKKTRPQISRSERELLLRQLSSITTFIEKPVTVNIRKEKRILDLNSSPEYLELTPEGSSINEEKIRQWVSVLAEELYADAGQIRIIGKKEIRPGVFKAVFEGEQKFGEALETEGLTSKIIESVSTPERVVTAIIQPIPFSVYSELEQTPYDILSTGYSDYSTGNKPDRVYNFSLGLSRVSNSLVDRGQEISFNKALGGIDNEFKEGLSIQGTMAVPVLGGGICQASTTFFRAIANLGVPIKMHKNHSWDLSYYRKGGYGLDATIYPEQGLDVKGVNDYNSQLYLYAYTRPDVQEAYVLIYGKSDGRKVTLKPNEDYHFAPGPKTIKWTQIVEFATGEQRQHEIVSQYKK